MDVPHNRVVPRSEISIDVEPGLRPELASRARGGMLILDYFATRRCSVVIGDLTAKFRPQPPGERYVELASIDGIRVFAAERLLPLLAAAGPTLRLAGPRIAQYLALWLDQPERWIEFLEQPGVLAGKRPWRRRSRSPAVR
ncbi:MAG: hypothetical protein H0W81_12195 [Chloroflexi bacterium]|nr:hypothetical protein [Chloroflexota bacterium]